MNSNLDPIIKLLQSHDESDRKQGIVDLLSSEDPLTVAILNKLAAQDPSVEIRYYARRALDSLIRREEEPPSEPAALPTLKELFEAEDPRTRFEGLKAALQAGTEEALARIREGLGKEPIPQLQASFIIALGRLGSGADIPILAEYLQHGDARIRANAVEALATIGTDEAYTFLVPVLQDEDNRVKSNVIKALQAYGGAPLFELLKSMATESAVWMRDSALYSLIRFKTPQALGLVGQIALNDPLERIREKARKNLEILAVEGNESARAILAQLKSSQAPPSAPEQSIPGIPPPPPVAEVREAPDSIAALLASPEVEKRHWALLKIGQKPSAEDAENLLRALEHETEPLLTGIILAILKNINVPGTFQAIVPFLGSADDRVRANAAEALAAIDSRQASEHLIALLEDPNNRVRANTILALSKDGILDPLEPTTNLANDKREYYRRSALYVISCLRLPAFVPVIARLLEDPDVRVRTLAYDVLLEYDKAGIIQARELRTRADSNIKMQKERDRFFENEFDRMFSGLLQSIRSDEPLKRKTNQIPTPQKEKTAFCQLGKKAESKGVLPTDVREALSRIDAEISRLKAISASLVTSSETKTSAGNLKDGTRDLSESELVRFQLRKSMDRREDLLADAGGTFVKRIATLPANITAALQPELDSAMKNQFILPAATKFSILPSREAAIPEIFDLTLRLYQKHVVAFTLFSGGVTLAGAVVGIVSVFLIVFFAGIHPGLGVLTFLPVAALDFVAAAMLFALWKIMIALMIRHYVTGESPPLKELYDDGKSMIWPMVIVLMKKYGYLTGWLIIAFFFAFPVFCIGFLISNIYMSALFRLAGLLVFIVIYGNRYFPYLLVEPVFVLEQEKTATDHFERAIELFAQTPLKVILLFVFASLMMNLIAGTTVEIFQLASMVTLGTAFDMSLPVGLLGLLSMIFLSPLVFSNLVVYLLILRNEDAARAT